MKYCVVIPTFNNPKTLAGVVERVRCHVTDVIVVDDGSDLEAKTVAERLEKNGHARVEYRATNGGKGAAVLTGLQAAAAAGFTHAVQIDADGQHEIDDLPRFLEASTTTPAALVLGQPVFDASAPKSRLWGRRVSIFWCAVETMSRAVGDPLCGYRVYPIAATLAAGAVGSKMDFDPEIAVRLFWAGTPVVHVSTKVKYLSKEEGGVSHFHAFRDTMRISWMHTRLVFAGLLHLLTFGRKRLGTRG